MTKEEYAKLLESDYWKGYSYSIIKERNFTCEDCGAYYPGERNKLQVHHLVYRNIMPWSYKPEEMVVLCRECHQKRHGIIPTSRQKNLICVIFYSFYFFVKYILTSLAKRKITKRRFLPKKRNVVAAIVLILICLASLESKLGKKDSIEKEDKEMYSHVRSKVGRNSEASPEMSSCKTDQEETIVNDSDMLVIDEQENYAADYAVIPEQSSPEKAAFEQYQEQYKLPIYLSPDERSHQQVEEHESSKGQTP